MRKLRDVNVAGYEELRTPASLLSELPLSAENAGRVLFAREAIEDIISGADKRLLVVAGPCSVHDPDEALDYATRLKALSNSVQDRVLLVMRAYFEKPRTREGWPGLLEDPELDGSNDTNKGLYLSRKLLQDMTDIGMPAATEFLNTQTPQYLSDLVSYAVIGARTAESQDMRKMASGLSMPVGIKNSSEGVVEVAVDGVAVARKANCFRGTNMNGIACNIRTKGNGYAHIVLRGGKNGGNYNEKGIAAASALLKGSGLPEAIGVDCSHGNSQKCHRNQPDVFRDVVNQRVNGNSSIVMVMLESYLEEGNQKATSGRGGLKRGVSITDECVSWKTTERLVWDAYTRLG